MQHTAAGSKKRSGEREIDVTGYLIKRDKGGTKDPDASRVPVHVMAG